MCKTEGASQIADAAIRLEAEARYSPFHCFEPKRTRVSPFRNSIEQMYGTTHTSVIDAQPEIHRNGRALTVLFECEVAWEAELLLEVRASLWRADGVDDESQGVEG